MDRPLRVLHCPTMVGGNPQQLARAERRLGLHSHAVAFCETPFAFATDEVLWASGDSGPVQEVKRWRLFLRALRDFDVIHFNFGESLMPRWTPAPVAGRGLVWAVRQLLAGYRRLVELIDLPLLKQAGKALVVTFQGDDARQGDYCRRHFPISFVHEV